MSTSLCLASRQYAAKSDSDELLCVTMLCFVPIDCDGMPRERDDSRYGECFQFAAEDGTSVATACGGLAF